MTHVIDWFRSLFDTKGRKERAQLEWDRDHERRMAEIRLDSLDAEASRERERAKHEAKLLELKMQIELAEKSRHEQTLELVEAVLSRVQTLSTSHQEAITEVAKGVQANAAALNTWMSMMTAVQGPGETHTSRPDEEFDAEQQREIDQLKAMGYILPGDEAGAEEAARIGATVSGMFAGTPRG